MRERAGRRLLVALLFGVALASLALGGMIFIPGTGGSYDPNGTLMTVALLSVLAMVVIALPERRSRILLAQLLGALGAGLLLLQLSEVHFRFIAESQEGEFSVTLLGLLASSAVLWSTAAIQPSRAPGAAVRVRRYASVGEFATRALWSTEGRRVIVVVLGLLYGFVAVAGIVDEAGEGLHVSDLPSVIVAAVIAAATGLVAGRASNRTLKAALWVVAVLAAAAVPMGLGLELLFSVIALHASVAFAALAASAVAADSAGGARAAFTGLAILAAFAWIGLLLYGLLIYAIASSGYYS